MENPMLTAALKYREQFDLGIIPVKIYLEDGEWKKKPFVKWREFETRKATPEEIRSWWIKFPKANIGIVTGKINNLLVIDCDKYKDEYKPETVLQYIPDSIETPISTSPSGGEHQYYFYPDSISPTVGTNILPAVDYRGEGGFIVAPPSTYGNGAPYLWVDGMRLGEIPLSVLPLPFQDLLSNNKVPYRGECSNREIIDITEHYKHYKILQKGNRGSEIFKIGMALADGHLPQWLLVKVLERLALSCEPPFPESEFNATLASVLERFGNKSRNLASEVREWILLQEGNFSTTDILQMLQLTTKEEKKNLTVILSRFCNDEKIIEKHGDKRGSYRTRKSKIEPMDLMTEDSVLEVNVKLPMNLNEMCVLSPGNIIMAAGSKSSGKTAFLLNVAYMNMDDFEVIYLNSEMHQTEFKKRMKAFGYPLSDWNIKAYKCHNNFEDFIESDPKKIYIVDYLEVHKDFWEIAQPIRKIHEKLGDSVCFIGIQMRAGASLGRGGEFSAEKSRLYLTMDYHSEEKMTKVTIYDAKEPRPPHDNVRDMFRRVKIIGGYKLSCIDNWKW